MLPGRKSVGAGEGTNASDGRLAKMNSSIAGAAG